MPLTIQIRHGLLSVEVSAAASLTVVCWEPHRFPSPAHEALLLLALHANNEVDRVTTFNQANMAWLSFSRTSLLGEDDAFAYMVVSSGSLVNGSYVNATEYSLSDTTDITSRTFLREYGPPLGDILTRPWVQLASITTDGLLHDAERGIMTVFSKCDSLLAVGVDIKLEEYQATILSNTAAVADGMDASLITTIQGEPFIMTSSSNFDWLVELEQAGVPPERIQSRVSFAPLTPSSDYPSSS